MKSLSLLVVIASSPGWADVASARAPLDFSDPDPVVNATQGYELVLDREFKAGIMAKPSCDSRKRTGGICQPGPGYSLADPVAKPCYIEDEVRKNPNIQNPCGKLLPNYYLSNPKNKGWDDLEPVWTMGQWSTRGNMPTRGKFDAGLPAGSVYWGNSYKKLVLLPGGENIRMIVDGLEEYGGILPVGERGWPHFLLSQSFLKNTNSTWPVALDRIHSLQLAFSFRLLSYRKNLELAKNPSDFSLLRHVSMFPMYFIIQNLNREKGREGGYSQLVWVGIGPFDDRKPYPSTTEMTCTEDVRVGEGVPICNMPFLRLAADGARTTHDRNLVRFQGDVLGYFKEAVARAHAIGKLKSGDLSDYFVTGMNFGFEQKHLSQTAVEVSIPSLRMFSDKNPTSFEFNTQFGLDGWTLNNLRSMSGGYLGKGKAQFAPGHLDPYLISPSVSIDASTIKKIVVRMANRGNTQGMFRISFGKNGGAISEAQSIQRKISSGGGWREYVFDMSQAPGWDGTITRVRIDPVESGSDRPFAIDYVRFLP